mmetsp:Transcript_22020/g.62561  ORF Transcript_22020/g.62561 Transcript_22020/m.62561 type:complete len:269 (-) Transcript_22020:14-820(-)
MDAQHVRQLRGADRDARSRAEGRHHAVRHEVDDEAEAHDPQQDGQEAHDERQHCGAAHPVRLVPVAQGVQRLARQEAHERGGARLHLPDGAEGGVHDERQEGGVEAAGHGQARQHGEGQALRHEHEADREPGDGVALDGVGQGARPRLVFLSSLAQRRSNVRREPQERRKQRPRVELAFLVVWKPEVVPLVVLPEVRHRPCSRGLVSHVCMPLYIWKPLWVHRRRGVLHDHHHVLRVRHFAARQDGRRPPPPLRLHGALAVHVAAGAP